MTNVEIKYLRFLGIIAVAMATVGYSISPYEYKIWFYLLFVAAASVALYSPIIFDTLKE